MIELPQRPQIRAGDAPLPEARGPLSGAVLERLSGRELPDVDVSTVADPLTDHDFQLALYCCYELFYRGFAGVGSEFEWDPALLRLRGELEASFLAALHHAVACDCHAMLAAARKRGDAVEAIKLCASTPLAPSLSRFVEEHAGRHQFAELCVHRSAYQLKEADPHSWGIPRLETETKAPFLEIQADEYGTGDLASMHAELFAVTMDELDLDTSYGAYLDVLPGITLATTNLISLFGLHRGRLGALVGHLALFELTSPEPMKRYSVAAARHGLSPAARRFYDVHVDVDPHHAHIALDRLVPSYVANHPEQVDQVLFGAASLATIEAMFTRHMLHAWTSGRSSLLSHVDLAA